MVCFTARGNKNFHSLKVVTSPRGAREFLRISPDADAVSQSPGMEIDVNECRDRRLHLHVSPRRGLSGSLTRHQEKKGFEGAVGALFAF